METNEVFNLNMDGKLIGIGIYSYIEGCQLRTREDEKLLFRNVAQARLYAEKVKKMTNPLDYELNIVIGFKDENGEVIESVICYDNFDYVNGAYQLYADDGCVYNIRPAVRYIIPKVGYIIFNGNEKVDNPEREKTTSHTNFEAVRDAANSIIRYPNKPYGINYIKRYYTNMALGVKGSIATINVLYNSQIININQNRKNAGLKTYFPFDKEMDKYNSLYFYVQSDYFEPDYFRPKTFARCANTINTLMSELTKKRPDAQLKIIDIPIPIVVDGNIITKYAKKEEKNDDKSSKS